MSASFHLLRENLRYVGTPVWERALDAVTRKVVDPLVDALYELKGRGVELAVGLRRLLAQLEGAGDPGHALGIVQQMEVMASQGQRFVRARAAAGGGLDAWVRGVLGTLSPAEREEREVERLSKPAPSKKPPRRDLRRTLVKDEDLRGKDPEDRDLSLNYKKVGGKVPRDKHPKEPGDYWQTESAWGVWPKSSKHPTSAPDEEAAKNLAEGAQGGQAAPAAPKKPPAAQDPGADLRRKIDKVLAGLGSGDKDVRDALDDVLALDGKDFRKASKALLDRIEERKAALLDNQTGWAAEAAGAAETALEEDEDLSPEDLGKRAAEMLFMDRVLTNPANLAGTPLSTTPLGAEDLEKRGIVAYHTFRDLTPALRSAALEKAGAALTSMDEDDPRRPELDRIIDGLALACYLEGEDPVFEMQVGDPPNSPGKELPRDEAKGLFDFIDPKDWGGGKKTKDPHDLLGSKGQTEEVRLRPPMSPSFTKLAQLLDQEGEATALVMSPDDFYGPRGRTAIARALDQASDEDLAEYLQDTPFDGLGEALNLEHLGPAQRAALRDAIKRVSLEDMTTIQGVLAGLKKEAKPSRGGKKSPLTEVAAKARRQAAEDAEMSRAVRETVKCLSSGSGRDECEQQVAQLVLSGLEAFDKAVERLSGESGFELDPQDPHLAKVRHAVKTGDLSVLDQIVVKPGSLAPLSEDKDREDTTTMAAKPAPVSRKAADEISLNVDRLANLIANEAEALGVSPKLAAKFCRAADEVADAVDRKAGIQRSAAQRTADFDPSQIGEEVAGPLEDGTPRPYMKGEWTHQEFREIGDLQMKGKLDGKPNMEPRAPDPGAQMRPLAKSLRASVEHLAEQADLGQIAPARLAQVEKALRLAAQVVEGKAQS